MLLSFIGIFFRGLAIDSISCLILSGATKVSGLSSLKYNTSSWCGAQADRRGTRQPHITCETTFLVIATHRRHTNPTTCKNAATKMLYRIDRLETLVLSISRICLPSQRSHTLHIGVCVWTTLFGNDKTNEIKLKTYLEIIVKLFVRVVWALRAHFSACVKPR